MGVPQVLHLGHPILRIDADAYVTGLHHTPHNLPQQLYCLNSHAASTNININIPHQFLSQLQSHCYDFRRRPLRY